METTSLTGVRRTRCSTHQSRSILVILVLYSFTIGSTSAATITWTGAVSSDWNNSTNWTPQQVPTSGDTAVINSGTVLVAANAQFAALTFNGGTLSGAVLVRSNCVMNWNDGTLAVNGSLTVQSNALLNLQTSAAKYLDGPIANSGTVIWTGGTLYVRNNNGSNLGSVLNLGLWQMQGDVDLGQWSWSQ